MRDDADHQARDQAVRQVVADMRRTAGTHKARQWAVDLDLAAGLDYLDSTARRLRLAGELRDQGMNKPEARDALVARLGVSRSTAYRMLSCVSPWPPT